MNSLASRPPVRRRGVRRRGIILLMSLSLLTLFLMMLVTLIVITGQYRQSARVQSRQDRVGTPPHKMADLAIKTISVGDGTGSSVVSGHELFRDLYGGSWRGRVTNVYTAAPAAEPLRTNPGSTSSFLTFDFLRSDGLDLFTNTTPGDYTGCVLTFISGTAEQNVSVRVLEYVPPAAVGGAGRFTIERSNPEDSLGLFDTSSLGDAIAVNDLFVVNYRAFSGYGAGYGPNPDPDPANPPGPGSFGYNITRLQAQPTQFGTNVDLPVALLPRYNDYDLTVGVGGYGNANSLEYGGLHEDYDAVDYQNMFLASVPPGAQRADQIVPSFWRPELMNFWRHYTYDHDNNPGTPEVSLWYAEDSAGTREATNQNTRLARNAFYRRICLRPLPTDHPEFDGSNPDAALPVHPTNPTNVAWRFHQPLSLLPGSNDIDENAVFTAGVYTSGADEDATNGSAMTWPPMPDPRGGSAPPFDPVRDVNANGVLDQWDVDNDNDGITDSIWIDIGLPVQRMEDGKLYKPLVAFLIRDLDGLANLNAHLHPDFNNGQQSDISAGPLAGGAGTKNRPRGVGFGPAEIGFPSSLFNADQTGFLLATRYGGTGVDERPGRPNYNDFLSRLRNPTLTPFVTNSMRPSEWGTPADAWGTQAIGLDYTGQPWNDRVAVVGVPGTWNPPAPNPRPQLQTHLTTVRPAPGVLAPPDDTIPVPPAPFSAAAHPNGPTEGGDDPYEVDLYAAHAAARDSNYRTPDTLYTLAELERVLRWSDADAASLQSRLPELAHVYPAPASVRNNPSSPYYGFNDVGRRRAVTTHSSHIPAAPSAVPSERRAPDTEKWTLYHLFAQKLIANADTATGAPFNGTNNASPSWDPTNATHRNWVDNEVRKMMPWEAWHGMKFDLNRRWQNGFDDDNDGTVDEPDEVGFPETTFPNVAGTAGYGLDALSPFNQAFDHLGADPQFNAVGASWQYARQIYARQLYCTTLVLMDYDKSGSNGFRPGLMFDPADYDSAAFDPNDSADDPMDAYDNVDKADELFKRRLAQWAINVVDARDPDAICSPFEYDVNPYDGWQPDIDGNPATPVAPNPWGQRRLVWGVEAPHLLISEVLALHNRRVIDSEHDDSGNGRTRQQGDDDLDQHRVPQGSLFVELMAVGNRAQNDGGVPAELYDRTDGQLQLNRTSPAGNPVWRMAISAPHDDSDTTEQLQSAFYRSEQMRNPGGTRFPPNSYDPVDLNLLTLNNPADTTTTSQPVTLERFVHFAPTVLPAAGATTANTFYYRGGAVKVAPGQYCVVAPRPSTHLTLMDDNATDPMDLVPRYDDGMGLETARLEVVGNNFYCYDNFHNTNGDYVHPDANGITKIVQPIAMICGADPPATGWPAIPDPSGTGYVGLNVSEPLPQDPMYYPQPTDDTLGDGVIDGYGEGDDSEDTFPDDPFDSRAGMPLVDIGLDTQTTLNWRTVYLQRLANPLANFHPTQNPYITVDFAPVDLSVYNGDDRRPDGFTAPMSAPGAWDPDDPTNDDNDAFNFDGTDFRFMSRERGEGRTRTADSWDTYNEPTISPNDGHYNLWRHRFVSPQSTVATPDATAGMTTSGTGPQVQYRHNLLHTLGYLNVSMGMDSDPALTDYMPPNYPPSPGYQNYLGAPPIVNNVVYSFPWLNWPDRPYATPLEILTVPFSSQTTWFEDWTRDQTGLPVDPYDGDPASMQRVQNFQGYFEHLWNFFHHPANPRTPTTAAESPQIVRLLDWVETPSPFAGSREFFNAPNMDRAPGMLRSGNNWLSRFRDPGRMNLNTMPPELWDSLTYAHPSNLPDTGQPFNADRFADTRRGFPKRTAANPGMQTWQYPTRVVKPFRNAAKADLGPLLPDRPGYPSVRLRQPDVEATLLRSDQSIYPATLPSSPFEPLFAGSRHGEQHQHTGKNPYFRYEQMTRLPNLTSTNSNVYAVWLTVGYFEAFKTPPQTRNPALNGIYAGQPLPDGVWLGPEIGADTGRNRRHRAFYIIDRSIPVAFEPGNAHNFEKAILLRRYLD